jgi:hypothetical protein
MCTVAAQSGMSVVVTLVSRLVSKPKKVSIG